MKGKEVKLIAACFGWGAARPEVQNGPKVLQSAVLKDYGSWDTLEANIAYTTGNKLSYEQKLNQVIDFNQRLANDILKVSPSRLPIILGGDHSIAIGTWSGLVSLHQAKEQFGLIWIDAHMDSHTPQTTPSHNIHGMPVAVLMGYGEPVLVNLVEKGPKLNPAHVVLIGVRSFEQGEADLLKKLNVKIYYIEEVKTRGLNVVIEEARNYLLKKVKVYGVSLDIDAIDPTLAPGTGAPAPDGITDLKALTSSITSMGKDTQFVGLEIAEFDPTLDINGKTAHIISDVVLSFNREMS